LTIVVGVAVSRDDSALDGDHEVAQQARMLTVIGATREDLLERTTATIGILSTDDQSSHDRLGRPEPSLTLLVEEARRLGDDDVHAAPSLATLERLNTEVIEQGRLAQTLSPGEQAAATRRILVTATRCKPSSRHSPTAEPNTPLLAVFCGPRWGVTRFSVTGELDIATTLV
jgi:hypothetical protein